MEERIADPWGHRQPHPRAQAWPVRVDENVRRDPERWVQSACVLCSNGCALDIGVAGGEIVGVRGRASDRVNRGRLGPKGLSIHAACPRDAGSTTTPRSSTRSR